MANINTLISTVSENPQLSDSDICQLVSGIEKRFGRETAVDFINRRLRPDSVPERFPGLPESSVRKLKSIVVSWNEAGIPSMHEYYLAQESQDAQEERYAKDVEAMELGALRGKYAELEAREKATLAIVDQFKVKVENLTSERARLASALAEAKAESNQRQRELDSVRTKLSDAVSALQAARAESEELANRLTEAEAEMNRKLAEINSRYDELAKVCEWQKKSLVEYQQVLPDGVLTVLREMAGSNPLPSILRVGLILTDLMQMVDASDKSVLQFFDLLDSELFSLYAGNLNELGRLRDVCKRVLAEHFPKYDINWDMCGEQYDQDIHNSSDNSGNTVEQVVSALIRNADNGRVVRRAKVRTNLQ